MSIPRRLHHLAKSVAETAWLVLCAPPIAFWAWLLGPKAEGPSGPPMPSREHFLDAIEREARRSMNIPAMHPEKITADLPAAHEQWLHHVAASMWPRDEYAEIIRAYLGDSR